MNRGNLLQRLRRDQAAIGITVVWTLVLQVLLGLLPPQIAADTLAGVEICSNEDSSGQEQAPQRKPGSGHHEEHCILCGVACSVAGCATAGIAPGAAGFYAPQLANELTGDVATASLAAFISRYPSDIASRGPPGLA